MLLANYFQRNFQFFLISTNKIIIRRSKRRLSVLPYFDYWWNDKNEYKEFFQFFLISTLAEKFNKKEMLTFSSSLFRCGLIPSGETNMSFSSSLFRLLFAHTLRYYWTFQFFLISTQKLVALSSNLNSFSSSLFRHELYGWLTGGTNFQFFLIST